MPREHPYIKRLRDVRDELETVQQSLAFLNRNWQKYNLLQEMPGVTSIRLTRARDFLIPTYLTRLSAEFEGILKYHLSENHTVIIPSDTKVNWLISQVRKAEGIALDTSLRANLETVRAYRNSFVHSGTAPPTVLTFESVLSWYSTFVSKLPA